MKRIRQRSKRMQKLYRERRPFVAKFLEEHPWCQRCKSIWYSQLSSPPHNRKEQHQSTVVHEIQTRARGGDILDPENCRALCHECHMQIHARPAQATEEGWLVSGKKKQFSF